jgi:opacity protein-like surface antigen
MVLNVKAWVAGGAILAALGAVPATAQARAAASPGGGWSFEFTPYLWGAAMSGSVGVGAEKDWVDPYVGVRAQHPLAERWTLVGYADVGGFGVGSEFAWQAAAGVNYEFSKSIVDKFAYRYLYVDYDKDGFRYDMENSGVYLGAGIRF